MINQGFRFGSRIIATPLLAFPNISSSGRLAEPIGKPFDGPIDVVIRFYGQVSGGPPLIDDISKTGVELQEGALKCQNPNFSTKFQSAHLIKWNSAKKWTFNAERRVSSQIAPG